MKQVTFSCHQPSGDRRHFVTEDDVRLVLQRLPDSLCKRLKAVHFNDLYMQKGRLGYVRQGRDEIGLCALPPRISFGAYLRRSQSPGHFGAVRGSQWPTVAVRRFMLYDVLLHELGHLQVVDETAKSTRRRFADEAIAQDFAEYWCRELWTRPFDHSDTVHNPPSPEELEALRKNWCNAHCDYKKALLCKQSEQYPQAIQFLTRAVERYPGHALALELLGGLTYAGLGIAQSNANAIILLSEAVRLDPSLFQATIRLGFALVREDREVEARHYLERAIRLDPYPPRARAMYADVLADWGYFAEAEEHFKRTLKIDPKCEIDRAHGANLSISQSPC